MLSENFSLKLSMLKFWLCICLIMPVSANAEGWQSGFNMNGMNGSVSAIASDKAGNLYAGGDFTGAGNLSVKGIAKWDGTKWSALGAGLSSAYSPSVSAIAFDKAGNLYVGGGFTTAGGVSANNIAKWDGTKWSALGAGTDYRVNALAIDSAGNLYAGGDFTTAGDVSANNIAKWDGTKWIALGGVTGGGQYPAVKALVFDSSGNLYAGGVFNTAGDIRVSNIAKWDGTKWSALGAGVSDDYDPDVMALAIDSAGNLYAGGRFTTAGGVSASRIAKWDGTKWSALGAGMSGGDYPTVSSLAFDGSGNLYAGGGFTTAGGVSVSGIAKWNGTDWGAVGSGIGGGAAALSFDSAGNLYAGGYFNTVGGVPGNNIARWNGINWSALGGASGNGVGNTIYALSFDKAGNLYAGGDFTGAGSVSAKGIAKWDGTNWSALGTGISGDGSTSVSALAIDSSGNVYAGGYFTGAGSVSANNIAKWDGTKWNALGTGISGDGFTSVSALAIDSAGNLYAGGHFTSAGGVSANNIAKWDGIKWSALGTGALGTGMIGSNAAVKALAIDRAGNLYAGGYYFNTAGGVSANNIAKWDGTKWSALGDGIMGFVDALAFDKNGNLYVGGYFMSAGDVSANNIAKWDGKSWSALGWGVNQKYGDITTVNALAIDSAGNLYAGGDFDTAGGLSANRIAKWDGTNWSALKSGIHYNDYPSLSSVNALSFDSSNNLYVGGRFDSAGDLSSSYIAMWKSDTQTGPGLADVITVLRILSGISVSNPASVSDVNGDHKIGLEEVIYILQKIAGLR